MKFIQDGLVALGVAFFVVLAWTLIGFGIQLVTLLGLPTWILPTAVAVFLAGGTLGTMRGSL